MLKNDYWISPRPDGWAVQKAGARAARVLDTQVEAETLATHYLTNSGGGERITQGRDGRIRSKDTIGARDPFPPRDWGH